MADICINIAPNSGPNSNNISINHKAYCYHHNITYRSASSIHDIWNEFELFDNILVISNKYLFYEFKIGINELLDKDTNIIVLSPNNTLTSIHHDYFLIKKSTWSIELLKILSYTTSNIVSIIEEHIDITKVNKLQHIGYLPNNIYVDALLFLHNLNIINKPHLIYNSTFNIDQFDKLAININKKLGIYNVC